MVFQCILSFFIFQVEINEIAITFIAYFNVLIIFVLISKTNPFEAKIFKTITIVFYFSAFFGILQYLKLTQPFQEIYTAIIPRGNFQILDSINRGVSLFATEPSRAAIEFVFMAFVIRLIIQKRYLIYFDFFTFLFVFAVIKGGYGLLYSTIYLIFNFRKNYFKYIILLVPLIAFFYWDFLSSIFLGRGTDLVKLIFFEKNVLFNLINLSGFRIISTYGSIVFGLKNPIGGGFGNWKESSVEAMSLTGFNSQNLNYFIYNSDGFWSSVKPTSFIGNLMLDFGLFGTILFIYLLYQFFKKNLYVHDKGRFLILFGIYFCLFGYLGNPIPYICVALYYNKHVYNFYNNTHV